MSGENSEFTFSQIPPGSYRVIVNAKDLEPMQSGEIVVTAQEAYEMPAILLRVATANTQVTVRPMEVVAAEQTRAEERQRILGVIPNFYTSYIYDAAPLTIRQKYSLVFHQGFDPVGFIGTGIVIIAALVVDVSASGSKCGERESQVKIRWFCFPPKQDNNHAVF